MRFTNFSKAVLILCVAVAPSCSKKGEKQDVSSKQVALPETGFCGWNSLTLRNSYIRFDVVPSLGGRVMGYDLHGSQVLWHDAASEGKSTGSGSAVFNPGGAGIWFATQNNNGAGAPGISAYEGAASNTAITVTSPKDNSGLQFKNVYSLLPATSIVNMTLSMTNVSGHPVSGTLRHFAAVPADSASLVYAPVNKGGWNVVSGDKTNPAWLDVTDGIFRARFASKPGAVDMKIHDGWVAWHDTESNVVFVMMFPAKKGVDHVGLRIGDATSLAGQNTAGECNPETSRMELEARGPLTKLNPGETATLDMVWACCRCSGAWDLERGGVVAKPLAIHDGMITGEFGVFYGGNLQFVYLDRSGKEFGNGYMGAVSPISEVIVDYPVKNLPKGCAKIQFFVVSDDRKTTAFLGEIPIRE